MWIAEITYTSVIVACPRIFWWCTEKNKSKQIKMRKHQCFLKAQYTALKIARPSILEGKSIKKRFTKI